MLDAGSGKALRTIRVGTLPFGAALDGRHHQLFVGNFATGAAVSGTVQVIDTARGVMQRTIAVPAGPFSLALDPVRGHVVVAGLGDQSQLHGAWPSAVERAAQLLGRDAPTSTPSSSPAGAVTILRAAR
jgi:DNA-binding beta-propeller fold protein YncE